MTGGKAMDRPGYFFEPTILTGLSDGTRIVDEEQFGPALPVVSYRDLGDAIDRANATHFGLSGSVWGADPDRAAEVAAQLECGTAWVNTHLALAPQQPFGGFKWSGIGVENGPWGLAEFSEFQVVHRSKATNGLNVNTAIAARRSAARPTPHRVSVPGRVGPLWGGQLVVVVEAAAALICLEVLHDLL